MHKVYLLLRNNQKTGPYSLDELLQLQLQPFDLVWVEGRSAGWRYPGEIDSLKSLIEEPIKPSTTFEPMATPALDQETVVQPIQPKREPVPVKNVFVSMPGKTKPVYNPNLEHTAEVPNQQPGPVPQYAPGYEAAQPVQLNPVDTDYNRSRHIPEENYAGVFFPKKNKKRLPGAKTLTVAALILIVMGGGYFLLSREVITSSPSQNLVSQSVDQISKETTSAVEGMDQLQEEKLAKPKQVQAKAGKKEKLSKIIPATEKKDALKTPTVVNQKNEEADKITINNEPPVTDIKEEAVVKENAKEKPVTENAAKDKKKKLGEVIKNIFNKPKEKKEEVKTETVLEEPKPASNRQSTKREEGSSNTNTKSSASNNTALAEQIDITSNAPDNWMMGVKGLKLTLRNRSNSTIQSAIVEVIYYNENKELLERKTIQFNNISAKGKLTVAAPDHKWADHVEFKLGNVTGKEDRYASNK